MGKKADENIDKIRQLELLVKDLEEKWKRALADYQNLERRTKEERKELYKSASESLIVQLLPVLDNLEKATQHLKDEGLNLALRELWQVLETEGLVRIKTTGEIFNPQEMEAVDVVSGEEENKIQEEFRSGYKLHGKVIRAAQVRVVKKVVEKKATESALGELPKGDYM